MSMTRRFFLRSLWGLPLLVLPENGRCAVNPAPKSCLINRFSIAGFQYHDGPAVFHRLHPGQYLSLVAEPDNPFDPFAVRIDYEGLKMGYVPRSDNRHLSRLLRQDARLWCRVREVNEDEWPWRAVRVEVGMGDDS